jgi:altronate hydrolase
MAVVDQQTADVVHIHPADNVAVAARPLDTGDLISVGGHSLRVAEPVGMGHKLALARVPIGERVFKYGQTIGFATQAIEPGALVHSHNLAAGGFEREYLYATDIPAPPAPIAGRTFLGYRRASGKAGTRNYLAVISSVNCSASVSRYIAERFTPAVLRQFPQVDGIVALTHKGGCGMRYGGEDHQQLNRVLAGFAKHANIGGYLLVGLGCETGTIGSLLEEGHLVQIGLPGKPPQRPTVLSMQDLGGTTKTVEAGVQAVAQMLPAINEVRRAPIPASELIVALQCGGSDGNSGVTANPALGVASDLLVAAGGTVILSETTEIYGAEHLLTRRARSRAVGEKLIERIRWWERYTAMFGAEIDNNPSPGNKAGGLTTIYEKSLGAVAKGGSTALNAVYHYAEPVTANGLVIMDTPGYDPVGATGQVAGGANLMCFTTGRGSCFGCKPTPSIKIATNTPMYQRMIDDMDVNAGVILAGTPVAEVGRQIFELMLAVASGEKSKSEQHGIGDEEFAPWSIGPML